jgi:hypothetical protein
MVEQTVPFSEAAPIQQIIYSSPALKTPPRPREALEEEESVTDLSKSL